MRDKKEWYEETVFLKDMPDEIAEVFSIVFQRTQVLFDSRKKHLEMIGDLQNKAYKKDEYVEKLENIVKAQESLIKSLQKYSTEEYVKGNSCNGHPGINDHKEGAFPSGHEVGAPFGWTKNTDFSSSVLHVEEEEILKAEAEFGGQMLIGFAVHMGITETIIQIEDYENAGIKYGDWEIKVTKIEKG